MSKPAQPLSCKLFIARFGDEAASPALPHEIINVGKDIFWNDNMYPLCACILLALGASPVVTHVTIVPGNLSVVSSGTLVFSPMRCAWVFAASAQCRFWP